MDTQALKADEQTEERLIAQIRRGPCICSDTPDSNTSQVTSLSLQKEK